MSAALIVDILLENIDSLEGVPDHGEFFTKSLRPGTPEHATYRANWNLNNPPKTMREAIRRGINFYVQNGRRFPINVTRGSNEPIFQNSRTMATNRNARRKSFGYRDTYSMRERGWPTATRKPDGSDRKRRMPEPPPEKYEI